MQLVQTEVPVCKSDILAITAQILIPNLFATSYRKDVIEGIGGDIVKRFVAQVVRSCDDALEIYRS